MQGSDSEDSKFTEDVEDIKKLWNKFAERNKFNKEFQFRLQTFNKRIYRV